MLTVALTAQLRQKMVSARRDGEARAAFARCLRRIRRRPLRRDPCMLRSSARRHCDRTTSRSGHPKGDLTYGGLDAAASRAAHALLASGARTAQPSPSILDQGRASIVWISRDSQGRIGLCATRSGVCQRQSCVRWSTICHLVSSSPGRRIAPHARCSRYASRHLGRPACGIRCGPVAIPRCRDSSRSTLSRASSTSGSTGGPKAVADTHCNVLANIRRYADGLRFAPGDTLSLVRIRVSAGTMSRPVRRARHWCRARRSTSTSGPA